MPQAMYCADETVRRGQEIYEQTLRALVEPSRRGQYVVLDVETGDYEMGADYHGIARGILARKPGAALCVLRIGYSTAGLMRTDRWPT